VRRLSALQAAAFNTALRWRLIGAYRRLCQLDTGQCSFYHNQGASFGHHALGGNFHLATLPLKTERMLRNSRSACETLYDLLGALPSDDAESLRAAFRNAVKGAHPDVNQADPDAALKFRQILRANEILSDKEERAAYDYLLKFARREQEALSKRAKAATIYRFATGVMALAGISVVFIGGYLLFAYVNGLTLAPKHMMELFGHTLALVDTVTTERSDTLARADPRNKLEDVGASEKLTENPEEFEQAWSPSAVAVVRGTGSAHASASDSPVGNLGTSDVQHYLARGISAYRGGNLYLALAAFNLAIQVDPSFSDAYINRGIVLHRIGDLQRAFADVAQAKSIGDSSRNKTPLAISP
jgi:curved DNA-binding protein CbpA